MTNSTLSNSVPACDATDKLLASHASDFAAGEVSKIKFIEDAAAAFKAGTLRFEPFKGKRQPHEGDHAEYAIKLWNTKRAAALTEKAAKAGKPQQFAVRGVDDSKKSNLRTILRATILRPDFVGHVWKLHATMTNEDRIGRTYEAIVAAATAQARKEVFDAKTILSDNDLRVAMTKKVSETDEGKSLDALVKKLGKMAETFPENAKAYMAAAKALAPIVSLLKGDAERTAFIESAVAIGHDAKSAAAFYDARHQKAAA